MHVPSRDVRPAVAHEGQHNQTKHRETATNATTTASDKTMIPTTPADKTGIDTSATTTHRAEIATIFAKNVLTDNYAERDEDIYIEEKEIISLRLEEPTLRDVEITTLKIPISNKTPDISSVSEIFTLRAPEMYTLTNSEISTYLSEISTLTNSEISTLTNLDISGPVARENPDIATIRTSGVTIKTHSHTLSGKA